MLLLYCHDQVQEKGSKYVLSKQYIALSYPVCFSHHLVIGNVVIAWPFSSVPTRVSSACRGSAVHRLLFCWFVLFTKPPSGLGPNLNRLSNSEHSRDLFKLMMQENVLVHMQFKECASEWHYALNVVASLVVF